MGASTSRVPHPDAVVKWYRTKLTKEQHKALHQRSNVQAFIQTLAFFGMLVTWFALALYFFSENRVTLAAVFVSLYGMQSNFLINAMHELGHGSVFKSKFLNALFMRIFSFLGWLHPDMFFSSHLRHHRYTQNFPHDQENPMRESVEGPPKPVILTFKRFLLFGFINFRGFYDIMEQTIRAAAGVYPTKHLWWTPMWEDVCYPPAKAAARLLPMRWAQFMLFGHAAIAVVSIVNAWYLVPVMLSLGPFINGWLFFLCNSTQHVGMHHGNFNGDGDSGVVNDFRLSCRSFYLNNPIVRCWYWHMNFHIEHHMYAAVPCYHLAALHEAIKHDLPPTPNGLIAVWKEIIKVTRQQIKDPNFVSAISLPNGKKKVN